MRSSPDPTNAPATAQLDEQPSGVGTGDQTPEPPLSSPELGDLIQLADEMIYGLDTGSANPAVTAQADRGVGVVPRSRSVRSSGSAHRAGRDRSLERQRKGTGVRASAYTGLRGPCEAG